MMTFFAKHRPIAATLFALLVLFPSCTSSMRITSEPAGASVFADGLYVGETPMRHRDAKPSGTHLDVRLEKEGYETFEVRVSKDARLNVKALLGAMFVIPLAWILGYPRARHFVLDPVGGDAWDAPAAEGGTYVQVRTTQDVGGPVYVVVLEDQPCSSRGDVAILEASVGVRLMRHYDVLERRNLDVVLSETQRTMNGVFDESSVVEAGKLSGAKGVVLVRRRCADRRDFLSMRWVDCETGAQHWAATAEGASLDALMAELSAKLAGK